MSRDEELKYYKELRALFVMRARKAAAPFQFGYAIRVYDEIIEKLEH